MCLRYYTSNAYLAILARSPPCFFDITFVISIWQPSFGNGPFTLNRCCIFEWTAMIRRESCGTKAGKRREDSASTAAASRHIHTTKERTSFASEAGKWLEQTTRQTTGQTRFVHNRGPNQNNTKERRHPDGKARLLPRTGVHNVPNVEAESNHTMEVHQHIRTVKTHPLSQCPLSKTNHRHEQTSHLT